MASDTAATVVSTGQAERYNRHVSATTPPNGGSAGRGEAPTRVVSSVSVNALV
jgi:hypothetical protein